MIIINAVHKAGTILIVHGNFSRSLKKIQPLVLVQGPLPRSKQTQHLEIRSKQTQHLEIRSKQTQHLEIRVTSLSLFIFRLSVASPKIQ